MKMNFKRLFCLVLTLGLLLSTAACGSTPQDKNEKTPAPVSEEPTKPSEPGSEASAVPMEPGSAGEPEVQPSGNASEETEASSTRNLVVYFSRTGEQYTVGVIDKGNTAIVAEMIAEETGADLFEVRQVDDHYPMTYKELTDVAKQEQNDKARPAYAGAPMKTVSYCERSGSSPA